MLDLIENVKLVKGNSIDLVESIEARDVLAVSFDNVDNIVFCGITLDKDVSIVNTVLLQDCLDGLVTHTVSIHHAGNGNTSLVLSLKVDLRRTLVEPNSEAFQLMLDDLLVPHGSGGVKHDDDEITRAGHCDDLLTATLSVLGTLNDTRQIQQLDLGSLVP